MNSKYLQTLEYDKIIDTLGTYCKTYVGKDNLRNVKPSFSKLEVLDLLELTDEAISLIYRKSNIPLSEIPNISSVYKKSRERFYIN